MLLSFAIFLILVVLLQRSFSSLYISSAVCLSFMFFSVYDRECDNVWNSLPARLRCASISRGQFRDGLKTHVFLQAYTLSSKNFSFKSELIYLFTYLLTYLLSHSRGSIAVAQTIRKLTSPLSCSPICNKIK